MREACPVWVPEVGSCLEQFLYAAEELRQYVVYTYYDKGKEPLYVGCSKAFYDAHYFNSQRLSFFDEVEYIGFIFYKDEEEIKDAKKYVIRARDPKHNQRKNMSVELFAGLDPSADDFVVARREMEELWKELNG